MPTQKQIEIVEKITKELNIEFPIFSKEYNANTFYHFIKYYLPIYSKSHIYSDIYEEESIQEEAFNMSYFQ